ncbi:MAG: M48 family metalloprotease [Candidatus Adiutrix sp.]|jgi:predicted Zn-dependent protease|nr:M48 family metalloprotease [Candidatus Adiutrix sp.]
MKKNRLLVFIMILAQAALLPPPARGAEMTPQKEKDLGRRFHLQLAATGAIVDDPIMTGYLRTVTERVLKGAGLQPGQFSFYLLQRSGLNAFAVPGGYIYINTETVYSLENEGQLAAILCHEAAHLTANHFARRLESSSTATAASLAAMLAGVLVAGRGGPNTGALGQAMMAGGMGAGIQNLLANSREDEAEADAKGRGYLIKAGYQPRDMYGAFRILLDKTYQLSPDMPTYLTTHPALTSRLAASFSDAAQAPPAPPDPRYLAFRDRTLAGCGDLDLAQKIFSRRLNENPKDHGALHGLGLLAQRRQNLGQADQLIRQALALAPGQEDYLADLGDLALKRHQPAEAKGYYEKAHNRLAVLGLARTSELLGDRTRAAALYDQAVNMDPEDYLPALELAGRFFGQIGQMDKGHFYLGRFFAGTGQVNQAIFHYQQVAGQFKPQADRELKILAEIKKDERK